MPPDFEKGGPLVEVQVGSRTVAASTEEDFVRQVAKGQPRDVLDNPIYIKFHASYPYPSGVRSGVRLSEEDLRRGYEVLEILEDGNRLIHRSKTTPRHEVAIVPSGWLRPRYS